MNGLRPLPERGRADADAFAAIVAADQPVVLRGQKADWPAVAAAGQGGEAVARYIAQFDRGAPVQVMVGPAAINGRFFYRDDWAGFNFTREQVPIRALLGELLRLADTPEAPALYAGSAPTGEHLPGWAEANPLDLPLPDAVARVWIGNATRVATHYDGSANLACVVAGKRRFLLFPPDQLPNLYIGPLDRTMAGQPASLVDPDAPDLKRYPRYAEALRHAMVAELGPGDAIYMPALWWHNIQAQGPLNVLVNYWSERPGGTSPFVAMVHALMAVRDLPARERAVWRAWFDHYVFNDEAARAADYLPPAVRGVLGAAAPSRTERIRQFLLRALAGPGG
ncbi:Cupin-like domain-containing protein [Sphingomonas guangdongensis]|uniref:Cupin-like domain-containing protein n=2 Tax=Sphingomonas guangdongensis TaxID=1141890 RepID=A0A285QZX8_9SPHN|nr:Cupin-like domain-containing protein [Sphingomonas guangdongensis]